jgi:hypothetical protein
VEQFKGTTVRKLEGQTLLLFAKCLGPDREMFLAGKRYF